MFRGGMTAQVMLVGGKRPRRRGKSSSDESFVAHPSCPNKPSARYDT